MQKNAIVWDKKVSSIKINGASNKFAAMLKRPCIMSMIRG